MKDERNELLDELMMKYGELQQTMQVLCEALFDVIGSRLNVINARLDKIEKEIKDHLWSGL